LLKTVILNKLVFITFSQIVVHVYIDMSYKEISENVFTVIAI